MANVLIIEDDDMLRRILVRLIAERDHDVAQAAGGRAGLALLDTLSPDVVVTDIVMDEGEGIETIIALKQRHPDMPIVAISANQTYLDHSLKLGASRALLKPFQRHELVEAIETLAATGAEAAHAG